MPEKLGKGGAGMQNYVPAGNGDASGEYGDNESGSNVHFKAFKKPQLKQSIENKQQKIKKDEGEKTTKDTTNKNSEFSSKYQTKSDKKIQEIFNGKTQVCFGKGYSAERVKELETATETIIKDFNGLGDYINYVGDRTNLEHYINEQRQNMKLEAQEIRQEMERIKEFYIFPSYNDDELRRLAEQHLRGKISLINKRGAYAYWQDSTKALVFMGVMKKRAEDDYEYLTNFKSSNKVIGTYYHELGHSVDYFTENKLSNIYNKLSKENNVEKFNNLVKIKNEFYSKRNELIGQNLNPSYEKDRREYYDTYTYYPNAITLAKLGKKQFNVSKYANTNSKEFVAECFSAHYTNMNNELATQTVNLYKDVLEKLKEFE